MKQRYTYRYTVKNKLIIIKPDLWVIRGQSTFFRFMDGIYPLINPFSVYEHNKPLNSGFFMYAGKTFL
jgi:hypothetical protein